MTSDEEPRGRVIEIRINRAPVLTLWATIVAERLGYSRAEALTLGRALAGYAAYAKAKSLGLIEESRESPAERRKREQVRPATIELMGRRIPVAGTAKGQRVALDAASGKPTSPVSVTRYLEGKFKDGLAPAEAAMRELAASIERDKLAATAFRLYEKFRPDVPVGTKGWGAAGVLDLAKISKAR